MEVMKEATEGMPTEAGEVAMEVMKEATTVVPEVMAANGADLAANGVVATEVMLMEAGEVTKEATEVTEAAMVATEEVIPPDLEARPHGVCPEVCAEVETSKCVVGVVWVAAEVGPKETNLTKNRGIKKERKRKKGTSMLFPALNLLC